MFRFLSPFQFNSTNYTYRIYVLNILFVFKESLNGEKNSILHDTLAFFS